MDNLNNIKLNFSEIDEYNFPIDIPFKLQVDYNDIKYDFVIRFSSNNKNLICCGSGLFLGIEKQVQVD